MHLVIFPYELTSYFLYQFLKLSSHLVTLHDFGDDLIVLMLGLDLRQESILNSAGILNNL
jgi:hypothetical protein